MTTKTYLPLFSGFYGSIWEDPCFDGEEEYVTLSDGMDFIDIVDWNEYYNAIAVKMCEEIKDMLSDFVSDITFERVSSPKYYNFENDSIYCDITFDMDKVLEYINDNRDAFDEYIQSNYTSRDGFISSYTNNPVEWLEGWQEDNHKVGSVLQFICINEDMEEPMYFDDLHISYFYTI